MKEIPVNRLEKVLGGHKVTDAVEGVITNAVIDSREAEPNTLFIPLTGERFNGHDFISDAIENGANAIVSEKSPEELGLDLEELNEKNVAFIVTNSVVRAMRRLAAFNRDRSGIPIIAVTGSSGKTTTKDIIASVMGQKFKVRKTLGNLNNIYGVPLTIYSIEDDDEMAVIEMGMDHLGEIAQSIRFVKPQVSVITNIGQAHMEKLGSTDNILKAKSEILSTLTDKDTAILNGDDQKLNQIEPHPFKIMRYGVDSEDLNIKADNWTSDINGVGFDIGEEHYTFRYPGKHNIYNVLSAISIAKMYGLDQEEIQNGLDSYEPSDHRLNIEDVNGVTVIDDSYNANPDAMKAALQTLKAYKKDGGRAIAVLGDMFELGEASLNGHLEVGREAARQADYLIGVGEEAQNIIRGAIEVRAGMRGQYFRKTEDVADFLKDFIKPGDTVLLKASHGMNFSEILDKLKD